MPRYRVRKPNRPKKRWLYIILKSRLFWLSALGIIVLSIAGYFAFYSGLLKVKNIQVYGTDKTNSEDVKLIVQKEVSKNIFSVIPNNILSIASADIKKAITEAFPIISKVSVSKKYFNSIDIELEERKPALSWCNNDSCFNLDNRGFAYENGTSSEIVIKSDKDIQIGQTSVSLDFIENIGEVKRVLKGLNADIEEILAVSDDRINIKIMEGWMVYLKPDNTLASQLENLKLVLEQKIPPENRRNLEYIDIRFGNKIYYKYKNRSIDIIDKN
jgi:cell division septal protein FtsQ